MLDKKAQGMPMNVIIIAIIVLVVLVIVIAFFAGGFTSIGNKIRDLFGGRVQGQALDIAIQTCQDACETARTFPLSAQPSSNYCNAVQIVDLDSNLNTPPEKVACSPTATNAAAKTTEASLSPSEKSRGITANDGHLNVECEVSCT